MPTCREFAAGTDLTADPTKSRNEPVTGGVKFLRELKFPLSFVQDAPAEIETNGQFLLRADAVDFSINDLFPISTITSSPTPGANA